MRNDIPATCGTPQAGPCLPHPTPRRRRTHQEAWYYPVLAPHVTPVIRCEAMPALECPKTEGTTQHLEGEPLSVLARGATRNRIGSVDEHAPRNATRSAARARPPSPTVEYRPMRSPSAKPGLSTTAPTNGATARYGTPLQPLLMLRVGDRFGRPAHPRDYGHNTQIQREIEKSVLSAGFKKH